MIVVEAEVENILKSFPKIELSYDKIIHKKVYNYDIMIAIPEGITCYAWFSTYKDQNVCYMLELDDYKRIKNVSIVLTSFSDSLSYGTILYGILFKYKENKCFAILDIYYYKSKPLLKETYNEKLDLINNILASEISQISIHSSFIIFGLPLITNDKSFTQLLNDIEVLPYKIKIIQYRYLHKHEKVIQYIMYFKPGNKMISHLPVKKAIFKICPDIQNDIYHLYTWDNGKFIVFDIAYIPDYKTSVLMNKLFRNIKENDNLDALEESDDEEEFENEKIDKFVYLNKSFKMHCIYHAKFKKWVPINLVEKKERVITLKELNNIL
jgi:hypothetical protein